MADLRCECKCDCGWEECEDRCDECVKIDLDTLRWADEDRRIKLNKRLNEIEGKMVGNTVIKAERIFNGWKNYCRESRIFRILEWFGVR